MSEKWVYDTLEKKKKKKNADVGGGAIPNDMHGLSDIALRWMLREIVKSQCGILFDQDELRKAGISLKMFDGTVKEQDDRDALKPLHGRLGLWWIVELLPLKFRWQDASGKWVSRIR